MGEKSSGNDVRESGSERKMEQQRPFRPDGKMYACVIESLLRDPLRAT